MVGESSAFKIELGTSLGHWLRPVVKMPYASMAGIQFLARKQSSQKTKQNLKNWEGDTRPFIISYINHAGRGPIQAVG